jgi:hypothetical protein
MFETETLAYGKDLFTLKGMWYFMTTLYLIFQINNQTHASIE